ncbi:MAG: hypothetical protein LBC55_07110 [Desulfovibrio sp.]|jgi:hypothetical protein|nr:hypothetical protein [Desulfovibrio sp.]
MMNAQVKADPKLTEAFTLMWATYPAPASLVHKSRTIIAVNEACRTGGRQPGMRCAEWGAPDRHQGCRANHALREQKAFHKEVRGAGGVFRVYWLPVPDYPDFYVHFTTETINLDA